MPTSLPLHFVSNARFVAKPSATTLACDDHQLSPHNHHHANNHNNYGSINIKAPTTKTLSSSSSSSSSSGSTSSSSSSVSVSVSSTSSASSSSTTTTFSVMATSVHQSSTSSSTSTLKATSPPITTINNLSFSSFNDRNQVKPMIMMKGQTSNIMNNSGQVIMNNNINKNSEVSLAWRNLRYEVTPHWPWWPNTQRTKVILRRLNGHVRYQTMTGFMGPSGAGKTTLLNCLNGNIQHLCVGSEIYVNRNERKIPVCGFIEQHVHETIIGRLTVREILRFAFRFKNSECSNSQTIDQHIEMTIAELMLDHRCLERRFEQCSGGEQKRIAVAQELMSIDRKPQFLFIDEPTTGLDSQAALEVMRCLRQLTALHRITVLVSIHLPNDEILRMFDQLYILAKGGVAIYAGSPANLGPNFRSKLGIEVEGNRPPVEEYLKLACHGIDDSRVSRLADQTLIEQHQYLNDNQQQLRFLTNGSGMPRRLKTFTIRDFFLQLYRIFYIVFVVDFRILSYQLLVYACFLLTIATVFDHRMIRPSMCYPLNDQDNSTTYSTCQQQLDDEAFTDSYIAYQAFCNMFFGVIMLGLGAILFTPMLKMFRHEHRNRWYSMSSFYWPFVLVRLVEVTMFSLFITILIYFPTEHHQIDGYRINWYRFWHFAFFIWLSCVYMQTFGQLLSLIFLDQLEISIVMAQLWFIQLSLVNGYLINLAHLNIPILMIVSNILATKPISNGLMFSFYGIDRCDPDTEMSIMMMKFNIDEHHVYTRLIQVFINIFIIRSLTFALMCFRFSWGNRKRSIDTYKLYVNSAVTNGLSKAQPIPIDYDQNRIRFSTNDVKIIKLSEISRIKHGKEKQFEQFSRNKIIVGWRSLNLFSSGSIKELRPVRSDSKLILRNLHGQFRFGTMNALMGTSGAGKTSLLRVLNGCHKTKLSEESRIYLSRFTPIRICFITQDVSGHLLPGLTAKQSLVYASRLKNSDVESDGQVVEHEKIAKTLLDELDISDTEDTLVQDCSGGERKRLALALELTALRMPNLICIDEPTSGLDSNSAYIVVACLRRLAHRHNLTIVASIHQPNTEILMMFDQCYVLARGGVAIYSGPPNQISQQLEKVPEINVDMDKSKFPIEQLIKYSSYHYNDSIVQKLVKLNEQQILNSNDGQDLMKQTQLVIDGIQLNRTQFSLKDVSILCQRYMVYVKGYLWLSLMIYIAIYLFYGLILRTFFSEKIAYTSGCINMEDDFNSTCNQNQERIEREMDLASNYRYNFYLNSIFLFIVVLQTSLNFSKESIYFFNEHRNGWYSTGAYYVMKSLYDITPMIPVVLIYILIVNIYEPIRPGIYWWLVLLVLISVIAIQGMGHLFALLTNGQFTILTITNIGVFLFLVILSNFFNPIGRMHYFYQLLSNLSICRFLNEATILLQYGFGRCGPKEIQATLYVMMLNHDDHFYHCLQMLLFNLLFYRVLSLAVLIFKSNPIENRRQRAEKIRKYQQHMRPLNSIIPGLTISDQQFCIKKIQI